MDRLLRLRAPFAVAALLALSLVAAARVGLGLSELVTASGSRAVAAARLAPNGSDGALTVLVGLLVVACCREPATAAHRRFAVWGAVLCAVSLLASAAALASTNLAIAGWNAVWLIPDLVVPVLVGVALTVLAQPEPVRDATDLVAVVPAEAVPAPAPEPDPALEPGWAADAAAGAVWRTAGDAARGAPATAWGSGAPTGWEAPALPSSRDDDLRDPRGHDPARWSG